ncbi:YhdP family protein [Limnobacter parvus]|uniref:TIGR02099 family protein n=1 Tax=Limnobacter parvus TaxID=2939690 RepID=A0ABT1XFW7_9BURK|nr:YhdP family protein [Limnobacter parvus]MCR2746170.1 TIGR02099 family protein [Limnobacter parvus]
MQEGTIQSQVQQAAKNPTLRRAGAVLFWALVVVYVPLCLALLAIKWLVLPEIDRYRPEIQQFLQNQTGTNIQIGQLQANWRGFGPHLEIENVRLPQSNGETGFEASRIQLDWSLPSILAFSPRLKNLELHSPLLSVQRNLQGEIVVAGVPFVDDGTEGNPGLDWLLDQRRVLLKNGILNWQDSLGQFPDSQAVQAELLIENTLNRHQAGLVFMLPSLAESPIQATLNFKTPLLERQLGDISKWKGTFHVDAVLDRTQPLETVIKNFGVDAQISQPQGQLWIDFEKGLVQRSLLNARVAKLRFANPQVDAVPFDMVNTSALIEVRGEHLLFEPQALSIRQLQGQIAGRQQFGPTDLAVSKSSVDGGTQWGLQISKLDAAQAKAILLELGPHLSQQAQLDTLKALDISGRINRVDLNWSTAGGSPIENSQSFNSDVEFSNLMLFYRDPSANSNGTVTGFKNLSGTFKGNDTAGRWTLIGKNSEVALPEIFASELLRFDEVKGEGAWTHVFSPDVPTRFSVDQLEARNADLHINTAGTYEFLRDEADVVDLKGTLPMADVAKVSAYLPLVVGSSAREWLSTNLKAGLAKNGEFQLTGRLSDFPFDGPNKKGVFRIEIPFEGGEFTYAPGWPGIQKVNGKATFNGKSMLVQAETAETQGVQLKDVQARIDNLDAWEPLLEIKGQGQGELGNMVAFVNQSPVREILNEALINAQVEGNANLNLQINIPIAAPDETQVKGDLLLKGNSIRVVRGMPTVSNVDGLIQFSNKGLFIDKLLGQALGGPVTLNGTTDSTGRMEIRANGTARARGLAQYLNPLAEPYLAGSTPYTVVVATREQGVVVDVNSQLLGLEVKLPSPFNKKADTRLSFKLNQAATNQGERWAIDLGPDGKPTAQVRAVVLDEGGQPGIDSLQFAVGAPLAAPTVGFQGDVRVPVIDLDEWREVFNQITSVPGNAGLMGEFMGDPASNPSMKLKVGIRTDRLNVGSKSFEGVSVAARTVENRWQFDVKAKGVDGYLTWIADKQRPDGAVLARFKTLVIPQTLDSDMRNLVEEPASSIPALDVQVDNFTLNDLALGSLKLIAVNQSREEQARATLTQRPREWKLEELRVENPESVTTAKGVWQYGANFTKQRTDIDVNQTVKNGGGLLTRLGMADVFRGGEGTLVGRLRWNGAPTNIDYGSLSGQFKLLSNKGQFLKADPGVAKLLGVLSLQSIPRRFALDFRDVFSEGFAYDTMEADVALKEGIASTQNFKMTGPSATVLIDGNLDLESETQNLNVVVLPDLNPAGGSLIYSVIAANPAVGIASLIADYVFKDPLAKIFSFQYQVSGPWSAPVIERVRKSDPPNNPTTTNARP